MTLKDLFSRYAKGKASKTEKRIVDTWFSQTQRASTRKPDADKMRQAKEEAWLELLNRQQRHLRRDKEERSRSRRMPRPWITYGTIAAAIALLIAIGLPLLKTNEAGEPDSTELVAQAELSQQFVTNDNMKKVTLADGSIVHMNMGSTLSLYKGKFNGHTREVWLDEGEAFFEVTKDKARPFIVHTADGLSTRVLGTSFNIKAYRELGEQVVSVKTGRVQVSKEDGDRVVLDPDNNASFDVEKGTLTAAVSSGTDAADWRNGRIVLTGAHIDEVALRLKQYYQADIINQNKVSPTAVVHFSFTTDMPLQDVVRVLADIYEVQYKIKDNQIILI